MVFYMFTHFVLKFVFGMLRKQCKYHAFGLLVLFLSSIKVPRTRARQKHAF